MITADSIRRQLQSSRHRQRGTLTNTVPSETEVDEMNRPIDVPTVTPVVFLWHPEQGAEGADSRAVWTGRRVVYFSACTSVSETSTLTHAGVVWQVVDVEDWDVGIVARLERTV